MKLPLTALCRPVVARECRTEEDAGFTLVEVLVALAIATLLFGGMLAGYIQTASQAEWSGYSLSVQAAGMQAIEQARSAVWDPTISKNELTNMNLMSWTYNPMAKVGTGYATYVLDVPITGTNKVVVTNYVTVKMLNLTGFTNAQVQMVTVQTVWPFRGRLFTNSNASYYGPDNRSVTSL